MAWGVWMAWDCLVGRVRFVGCCCWGEGGRGGWGGVGLVGRSEGVHGLSYVGSRC